MKNQRIFPGIILIGFGVFFFWQQAKISLFAEFISWPSLLMIVGIAFLCQGYGGKEYESILPGVILTGFGLHFHRCKSSFNLAKFIGNLYINHRSRLFTSVSKIRYKPFLWAFFFLLLPCLLLFYDKVMSWFGMLETNIATFAHLWPFALILIGVYLLFFKKK